MERTERFYKMLGMIRRKGYVTQAECLERFEVNTSTFKRDLEYLRDRMNVPVAYDRERRGYRFDPEALAKGIAELPGLWFSSDEAHALLTMHTLLSKLGPGLVDEQIEPLRERLEKLMATKPGRSQEVLHRIRIIAIGGRRIDQKFFAASARSLLERKQMRIKYHTRERDETNERDVSPQRLTHYRDNWYLDAWCHLKNGLRCFSVDSVMEAQILESVAKDVPEADLDRYLASSYGIFAGEADKVAKLRFSPVKSRWVSREEWHPEQKTTWDGAQFVLEVPYQDDRELLMDILRHAPDVDVLGPAVLRQRHKEALAKALAKYS